LAHKPSEIPFSNPTGETPGWSCQLYRGLPPEAKTVFVSKSGMIKRMNDKNPNGKQIRLTSLSSCAG